MPDDPASTTSQADPAAARRVRVLLPVPFPGALDYRVPDEMAVPAPGSFVAVTLGPRPLVGVVWEGDGDDTVPPERLKPLDDVLPTLPLPAELRRFVERVAGYTLAPPGAVLRMTMSITEALLPPRPQRICAITAEGAAVLEGVLIEADPSPSRHPREGGGPGASDEALALDSRLRGNDEIKGGRGLGNGPKALTAARRRALVALREGAGSVPEIARRAGCGAGVVRGLLRLGWAEERVVPGMVRAPAEPDWRAPGPTLSPDQENAARVLVEAVEGGGFGVTLLDGVTGSGKTETYFAAIAAALARGRQVLVLLPEIALGAQWLERFRRRFGTVPVEWHSDIPALQRRDAWRAIANGSAKVVVGARSALFLPMPELGLIVVDEEHDQSYKQEDGVCYQARDMAVLRASLAQIPVVLAAATPSLETIVNVSRGRYRRVALPRRHAEAEMPEVSLIDMRQAKCEPGRFLSPPLVEALGETLVAGEQALLFLNRRGYAPLVLCRGCGHRFQCPNCSAWLVEHRLVRRLQCHHCGYAAPLPAFCPECLASGTLVPCGPGVERLQEEVAARFPAARTALMVSDLLPGPRAAAELADAMVAHRFDLLIGTQIVAKGHHFPMLTLVGVVDADLGLGGGDLRAAERTYQLLHQVGGRAGRADRPGRVLLQTYMPEQPVMQALVAGDRDRFLETEAAMRRDGGWPPFGRLAALIVSAPDAEAADFAARALARSAPHLPGVEVLGPAPAPLSVLRGRHRRRLLVKAERDVNIQAILRDWLGRVKFAGSTRLQVDIDPYSFM